MGRHSAKEGRREAQHRAVWEGKGGALRAHHVCPLHILLKETTDLLLQQPGVLDVRHAVVEVCLEPSDQCLQVPFL